jgi:hypothetical protein
LGVHPNFWGAMYPLTLHLEVQRKSHARSCTMLFFVNITGFNSNSSSDWTIKN